MSVSDEVETYQNCSVTASPNAGCHKLFCYLISVDILISGSQKVCVISYFNTSDQKLYQTIGDDLQKNLNRIMILNQVKN